MRIVAIQFLLMSVKFVPRLEDSPSARQQRSYAIKPEESISSFRLGQFLGGHAFYRVQYSTIHYKTVCMNEVCNREIPRQISERGFAAGAIPDHVGFGQFGHVVFDASGKCNRSDVRISDLASCVENTRRNSPVNLIRAGGMDRLFSRNRPIGPNGYFCHCALGLGAIRVEKVPFACQPGKVE